MENPAVLRERERKKKKRIWIFVILLILFFITFFTLPYRGRVIDMETKQPIEGAVVEARYNRMFIGEQGGTVFHVRETLTDRNGEFYIPPYITLNMLPAPLMGGTKTAFVIYKSGYASINGGYLEWLFIRDHTPPMEFLWIQNPKYKFRLYDRTVELPKIETKQDRQNAIPAREINSQEKFLTEKMNEEFKNLNRDFPEKPEEKLK